MIPGVKRTDFSSLETGYPHGPLPLYGEDNLPDPWSNPQIQLLQKAFNPVAAVDTDFWNENKLSNEAGQWPTTPAPLVPGKVARTLSLFNDTLDGDRLSVTWRLRAGSPTGRVVDQDTFGTQIAVGGHRQVPITIDAPDTAEPLYLDLQVSKPGQGTLYRDATTVFHVQPTS